MNSFVPVFCKLKSVEPACAYRPQYKAPELRSGASDFNLQNIRANERIVGVNEWWEAPASAVKRFACLHAQRFFNGLFEGERVACFPSRSGAGPQCQPRRFQRLIQLALVGR